MEETSWAGIVTAIFKNTQISAQSTIVVGLFAFLKVFALTGATA
jgi:hypothetical protein